MGGIQSVMKYLPGMSGLKEKLKNQFKKRCFQETKAIINSMTPKERNFPDIVKASRKIRISKGSGTNVQDVNKLLKQFKKDEPDDEKNGKKQRYSKHDELWTI